jgi:hypothetical protein
MSEHAARARAEGIFAAKAGGPWLFGRAVDLAVFGGSALLAVALVAVGAALGLLDADAPEWVWIGCIVAVDVAHVWSTAFRVYLDPAEVRRRPLVYVGVPLACWGLGIAAYASSPDGFWRVLAYVAVFHFVRQQWGWVALYRRRAGETDRIDRVLDATAIYAATLYPLLWWHGHLPRRFVWFVPNDFVAGVAAGVADALAPLYWAILAVFLARQAELAYKRRPVNAGKVLVVATTWLTWWLGIIALDSDYAFTVTNVLVHGIPYFALTYRYGRARGLATPGSFLARLARPSGVLVFVGFVLACALVEETLWDRYVWHDRPWLFGDGDELSGLALTLLVPLLALPQATHYALDGFVWKVRRREKNPALHDELS